MTETRISVPDNQDVTAFLSNGIIISFYANYECSQNHSIMLPKDIRVTKVRIEDSCDCYLELTEDQSYFKKYVEVFDSDETEIEIAKTETPILDQLKICSEQAKPASKLSVDSPVDQPVGRLPLFPQLTNVDDEPENLDKDFLQAQLSVKHQSIIRNVLAVISSITVAIVFLLEKLGII